MVLWTANDLEDTVYFGVHSQNGGQRGIKLLALLILLAGKIGRVRHTVNGTENYSAFWTCNLLKA